jgi:hypothetical protein
MFEVYKRIYFKKPPIKKVPIKLRVLSDASVGFINKLHKKT